MWESCENVDSKTSEKVGDPVSSESVIRHYNPAAWLKAWLHVKQKCCTDVLAAVDLPWLAMDVKIFFLKCFILHVATSAREIKTRKPSCRWQTRATLARSLHGLRKSSGIVSCIASLPVDSVPMVSYYVLYSNCVCKMRRFRDTRLLKLPW